MIYLGFTLANPWWHDRFANLWHRHGRIGIPHKSWELELLRTDSMVNLSLDISWRRDHAGICLGLGLLGYEVYAQLRDDRHWDHTRGRWMQPGEHLDGD